MKTLITAAEVKNQALMGKKQILIGEGCIVTPAARDTARDMGVEFVYSANELIPQGKEVTPVESNKIDLASMVAQNMGDASVNPELVARIVKEVLATLKLTSVPAGPVVEKDKSGIRLIRGESVVCEPFSTGNPRDRVFLKDLLPIEDSPNMIAGMMEMDHSAFEWELKYDEYDYIIEGELEIIVDGNSYVGKPGDVFFIPMGTKITFSSPEKSKFLYVTYPANWQQQA